MHEVERLVINVRTLIANADVALIFIDAYALVKRRDVFNTFALPTLSYRSHITIWHL